VFRRQKTGKANTQAMLPVEKMRVPSARAILVSGPVRLFARIQTN